MVDDGLYPRFSDGEFANRYALVRDAMRAEDLEALVVYGNWSSYNEVQYFSNFPVAWEGVVIFPLEGEPVLLVNFYNHQPNARRVSFIEDVRWIGPDLGRTVADDLRRRGVRGKVGIAGQIPLQRYQNVRAALEPSEVVDFTQRIIDLRLVKSDEELAFIRRGAELTDKTMEALEHEARPGLVEHDLARIVQSAYLGEGGRNVIHFMGTTPMSAPTVPVPAQHQSMRRIEAGDVLLTEISAHYHGYMGQILRPFAIGAPPTDEYRRMYDVAVDTFERIKGVLRAGATSDDVIAQGDAIQEAGYSIYDDLLHGLNGGSWMPILWTRQMRPEPPTFVFQEDMTVVIQPAVVTTDASRGVQVGELVRITHDGAESFHRYPMRFTECGLD